MNNLEELLIANAELAADLLKHMADNEIDSDYFAVVTDSPNCGREVQSEHSVTETALMVAGVIDQLIVQLEAAQKEIADWRSVAEAAAEDDADWRKLADSKNEVIVNLALAAGLLINRAEKAEAALSAANEKLSKPVVLPEVVVVNISGKYPIEVMYASKVKTFIKAAGFTVEGE